MAGKVAKFSPVSMSFGTGQGGSDYREEGGSGNGKTNKARSGNIMEEYLSNFIDEDVIIRSLGAENERGKALRYLDRQFQENNSLLIFQKKKSLFHGFAQSLCDKDVNVRIDCTKLIAKILPQLGPDLDQCMNQVLPKIVSNIGNCTALQKESVQTLHICMKNSSNVMKILKVIADSGIKHEDPKTRRQIIHTFPTLLFPEFKHEDFFDVVKALVQNLSDMNLDDPKTLKDNSKVLKTMSMLRRFVGVTKFTTYVSDLPPTLQALFKDISSTTESSSSVSNRSTPSLPSESYLNGDLSHRSSQFSSIEDLTQVPSTQFKRDLSLHSLQDFGSSTYFDSAAVKNSLGRGYKVRPNYLTPARSPEMLQPLSPHYEFGFISRSIIEKLSSPDNKTRHQAVEDLKMTLNNLRDLTPLKQNIIPLISLLQPTVEDNNYRVSCSALQALDIIVQKVRSDIRPYVKLVVNAVAKRLGNKDVIRSECMKVLLHLEEVTDPGTVLHHFWSKLQHKQAKMREETINLIIASLLKFPLNSSNIDLSYLCQELAARLIDPKPKVRQAALECIAVIANGVGHSTRNLPILISAVDNVELMNDNASGIMSAVQARMVRKQLPRLKENMLVEYAVIPTSSIPMSSPQGADISWVLAVGQPNSQSSMSQFNSSMNSSYTSSVDGNENDLSRRYLSAGKQRMFPWAQDDMNSDKHPSSAPVQTQPNNLNETHPPPIRPRNTWGPESEKSPSSLSNTSPLRARTNRVSDPQGSGTPGYLEIHQRRQANAAQKDALTNVGSPVRPQKRVVEETQGLHSAPIMGRNMSIEGGGGYQPSFASSDAAARHARPNLANVKAQPDMLSNSCPTTFFDQNNQVKRFNKSPRRSPLASEPPGQVATDEIITQPESPIRLKPKLARSAKRRESPNNSVHENGSPRAPENMLSIQTPLKLKNSASPRLDRISDNPTVDKVRPIIKQNRSQNHPEQRPPKSYSDMMNTSGSESTLSNLPSHSNSFNSTVPMAVIRHPSHQMKSGATNSMRSTLPSDNVFIDESSDANNNDLSARKEYSPSKYTFDHYDTVDTSPLKHSVTSHEILKESKSHPVESSFAPSELITHPRLQQKTSSPIQTETPRTAPHAPVRDDDVPYKSSMDLIRHSAQKKRDRMQRSMSSGKELNAMSSSVLDGSFNSTFSGSTSGRATAPESFVTPTSSNSSVISPVSNKTNSHTSSPIHSSSRDSIDGFFINGFQSNQNRRTSRTDSEPSSTFSTDTGYVSTINDPRKLKKSGKPDPDANPFMTKPSIARPGSGRTNASGPQLPGATDPPPFKYNPNAGVSFNTHKTKSNVSIVGLGYGLKSPSSSESTILTSSSPVVTPTNSSTSLVASPSSSTFSLKQSSSGSSLNNRERRRGQRGSSLGMASTQVPGAVPDQDDDFNIKGRAIRDKSSSNLSETADLSPTPSKEDIPPWSSQSNELLNNKPPAGIYGKAVRHPSASSDISNYDDIIVGSRHTEPVPLSASLVANQFKKKEDLEQFRKTKKGKMKQASDLDSTIPSQLNDTFDSLNIENKSPTGQQAAPIKPKSRKLTKSPTSKVSPPRGRNSVRGGSKDSSISRNTTDILPCPNPERALNDAINGLQSATSEEWEEICNCIHVFRRLAAYHQDILASRLHEVFQVVCTNVRNLRSQVSRAAVVCLTDIYTHMRKPAVDTDIELSTRTLLSEYGSKKGVFMQEEIDKTFQYMVAHVTSVKILNALLAVGSGNRNKDVRIATSQFVSLLIEKMGPGKALSGVKDTTEKIFPAAAMFVTDQYQETRYYGRRILNELMTHHDFDKCVDRYLGEKQAQEVKDAVQMIKTRGVGSIGSAGSHKNPGSGVRRNGSTRVPSRTRDSSTAERLPQISSNSSRRRGTPAKSAFNDQDQEEIRVMCTKLSQGDLLARKEAVKELREKLVTKRGLVEENVVSIMDKYISLLTTSNSKLNTLGLENLIYLVQELNNLLPVQSLVPAVCRLLASKQHFELAVKVVNEILKSIDHILLLQQFATLAMYSPGKTKQICIEKLAELVATVSSRKPQAVERHVLPVLLSLLSEKHAVNLRRETTILARALYEAMGEGLIQYAENKNASSKIKEMIES